MIIHSVREIVFEKRHDTKITCTLFHAPHIIANELQSNIKITSGPVLDKPSDLAGLLTNLEAHDVLFIDEIHRLNPVVEEYLYSAMEDFRIDILLDSGPNARSVQIGLNPFTLIGATDPKKAEVGTIRNLFAKSIEANAIHGSDSDANAEIEGSFFFSGLEKY